MWNVSSRFYQAMTCLSVVLSGIPGSAFAQSLDLRGTVWSEAATSAGVADPLILFSIALFESGRSVGDGLIQPWPWTVRLPSGPVYATTRAEAERIVRLLPPATNADVGMMQVNLAAHGSKVGHPQDLVDPRTNIMLAARILAVALDSAPGDLILGLGRYHSWTEDLARGYGAAVWRIYFSLVSTQRRQVSHAAR